MLVFPKVEKRRRGLKGYEQWLPQHLCSATSSPPSPHQATQCTVQREIIGYVALEADLRLSSLARTPAHFSHKHTHQGSSWSHAKKHISD